MPSSFSPSVSYPVTADKGGTGIANNAASTLTISGNFATTFTVTGATSVTLPTSGTLWSSAGVILGPDGTESLPAFSFASQPNMGIARFSGTNMAFVVNGVSQLSISLGYIIPQGRIAVGESGDATAPGYSWLGDVDTGIFHVANVQGFCAGGVEVFRHTTTDLVMASGKGLQLGNAAVTGLVAGALAALTTASITIKDSTGTVYRIPCVTP